MNSGLTNQAAPIIVADVGGTNGRFALASLDQGETVLSEQRVYDNVGLKSFADLLALYLESLGADAPELACFATAGPNDGRHGMLTNRNWELNAAALEQQFDLEEILFVNDFKALACMTPLLPESASVALNDVEAPGAGPITVMGPGTGLGVAIVAENDGGALTISTEGGHAAFAPASAQELALHQQLAREFPHVYIELLLSGAGLVRIYDFLAGETENGGSELSPADITRAALAGDDARCAETVQVFLSILGSVAGDFALSHGAVGGVYLGGGILPRILPLLQQSDFCARFCAKGIMQEYMSRIPIRLITEEDVALRGAAQLFKQHLLGY